MIAGSEFPDGVRSICEDSEAEEMFGVKFVRKGLKEGSFDFFISDGLGVGVGFFAPTFFSLESLRSLGVDVGGAELNVGKKGLLAGCGRFLGSECSGEGLDSDINQ